MSNVIVNINFICALMYFCIQCMVMITTSSVLGVHIQIVAVIIVM